MAKDKITAAEYEALDAVSKGFYKAGPKGEDGAQSYVLDSEESKVLGQRITQKEATIREQAARLAELERKMEEQASQWAGIDPDLAREAMEAKSKIEAKEYLAKGDLPGLIAKHEESWKKRHAEEVEAAKAEAKKYQDHLFGLMVKDEFKRYVTAGSHGDGPDRKILPTINPKLYKAAEALFLSEHKPRIEVVGNGDGQKFRAVATVDGLDVEMADFMLNHYIPANREALFVEPQHEGGKRPGVTPSRDGSPGGTPRRILASDQATINASQDAIASGEAIVVDG